MLCCVVVSVVVECWGLFVLYGCSCVVLLCVVTCSLVMFVDVVLVLRCGVYVCVW